MSIKKYYLYIDRFIFLLMDTLKSLPIKVEIVNNEPINWNLLTLIVAVLTLIAAVIIPFAQKKYEEYKSIFNFKLYIKSQFGFIYNQATYNEYEYFVPSIKDLPQKEKIKLAKFARNINDDFKQFQNSIQPRILFHFILNLQNLCFAIQSIRYSITHIDIDKIKENTLANGEKLSKDELNSVYGLLLIFQSFQSITLFHDRFGNLKTIKREIKDNTWVGLKLDNDMLSNQQLLAEDMKDICNHEQSLNELLSTCVVLSDELNKYYKIAKPTFGESTFKFIVETVVGKI